MLRRIETYIVPVLTSLCALVILSSVSTATKLYAAPDIWQVDTFVLRIDTATGQKRYSRPIPMVGGANWYIVAKANDTNSAGMLNDSINFRYGYRTLLTTLNANGKIDTIFAPADSIVDTLSYARGDTLAVTGFITKMRSFTPVVNRYIQVFVAYLAGQKISKPQKAMIELHRNVGTLVRDR